MSQRRLPAFLEAYPARRLPNPAKWTLVGGSVAGLRTGFLIRELNLALDAGIETTKYPAAILIGHSHVDHSWSFPLMLSCRTPYLRPVYAPSSAWPMLHRQQQVCHDLSVGRLDDLGEKIGEAQGYRAIEVSAGQLIEDPPGFPGGRIEILPAYHPAESVGYGLSLVKKKLKPIYRGRAPAELRDLRREKVEITEEIVEPQLIFYGDTTIEALTDHREWKRYPVIIVECTGYPFLTKSPELIHEAGHIHFTQLEPVLEAHPDQRFILIHHSRAADSDRLREFEKTHRLTNFTIWINEPEPDPEVEIRELRREMGVRFTRLERLVADLDRKIDE